MPDTFAVKFTTENDAFGDDPSEEIVRILRVIADRIESGDTYDTFRNCLDANGNVVGVYGLKPDWYYASPA